MRADGALSAIWQEYFVIWLMLAEGEFVMLKTIISAVVGRLFPTMGDGENGTGHCHEPALDADSLPQPMKEKLMKAARDTVRKPVER